MRVQLVNFPGRWVLTDDDRLYPIAWLQDMEGNRVDDLESAAIFVVEPPGERWWYWVHLAEPRTIH